MSSSSTGLTAGDLMSKKLIWVSPQTKCYEAIQILVEKRVSGLPVVAEDGTLSGVISLYDFIKATISFPYQPDHFSIEQMQRMVEKGSLSLDDMKEAYVSDFMSHNVITVAPETTRDEMAKMMKEKHIHRLIVADQETNKPLGVISTLDLL